MRSNVLWLFIFLVGSSYCQESPNFLWLVCEDQSLFFSMYGDSNANTPHIDQLAKDGIIYKNCYTPSPVCAPSRSSLITGMYPTSIGTQHMRSYKKNVSKTQINPDNKLPYYSPKPSKPVRFFTEDLRAKGYYCTNNAKEDYNMMCSPLAWDESSNAAHWRNRKKGQAFFSIFNFYVTHESSIWKNNHVYDTNKLNSIKVPKIFPASDAIKSDFLANYKNIEILDAKIGVIIDQLKEDGLYDNTIIFFFSDHGGPFPRYKRSIYETGIRCPMIAKWINNIDKLENNQLISFIDFAPTILDAANIERDIPFEGISFYKKDQRNYIYAATDRFDENTDKRRCIRGGNYKLIYNEDTTSPIYNLIEYRKQMKTMQVLDSIQAMNENNSYFSDWYTKQKDRFELYDVTNDYYELNNIISYPEYEQVFKDLRSKLFLWMRESDFGNMSESTMLNNMFTPTMAIPKMGTPEVIMKPSGYVIEPMNLHTSIGWRNKNETSWKIYKPSELIKPTEDFDILLFQPGFEVFIRRYKN